MGTVKKSTETSCDAWLERNVLHVFGCTREWTDNEYQCENDSGGQASDNNVTDFICGHDDPLFLFSKLSSLALEGV